MLVISPKMFKKITGVSPKEFKEREQHEGRKIRGLFFSIGIAGV